MAAGLRTLLLVSVAAAATRLLQVGAQDDSPMPGGFMPGSSRPVDVNAPEVQKAARAGVDSVNRASNQLFLNKIRRVLKAKEQVVQGMMYRLTVEIGATTCKKRASSVNSDECDFHMTPPHAQTQICKFKVWDRPWLGPMEVVKQNCTVQ
ncbi:cystatin-like [Scyliorhinus canicula]|uniref:cystatin-like n=1 Tax=Scyliorhinus canicula TaxID=7830 RepID=UPI0018F3AE51|nr:cystatin-like [Scyliorhinus canicula]